MSVECPT
jgi:hypothetical protein